MIVCVVYIQHIHKDFMTLTDEERYRRSAVGLCALYTVSGDDLSCAEFTFVSFRPR